MAVRARSRWVPALALLAGVALAAPSRGAAPAQAGAPPGAPAAAGGPRVRTGPDPAGGRSRPAPQAALERRLQRGSEGRSHPRGVALALQSHRHRTRAGEGRARRLAEGARA